MGKVEDDAYKTWLEDLKNDAESIEDPEEKKAIELVLKNEKLGRRVAKGVVGSKKLYQELNALNEDKLRFRDTQDTWKAWRDDVNEKYQAALSESEELKKELKEKEKAARALGLDEEADELRAARSRVDDSSTQKELEKLRNDLKMTQENFGRMATGIPAFVAAGLKLSKQYAKDGFEVDDQEVVLDAARRGVPLETVYEERIATQKEKRAKDREEKLVKDAEARGREQALTQRSSPEGFRPTSGVFADVKPADIKSKLETARAEARQAVASVR